MQVELRGVSKHFGQVAALQTVDWRVRPGQRVALIGPNGSGKSTLTRVVMGLVEAEGRVLLNGRDPRRHRVSLARQMAYVPQIAPQFSAPVADVVRMVAAVRKLPWTQLVELGHRLDLDVEGIATRSFKTLSGGMKQKLLLTLALAAPVSLLLLDEPTASLDTASRDRFYALFGELTRERRVTVILCSHRMEEIQHLVEHITALQEGVVVYDGDAEAFLAQRGQSVSGANGLLQRSAEVSTEAARQLDRQLAMAREER